MRARGGVVIHRSDAMRVLLITSVVVWHTRLDKLPGLLDGSVTSIGFAAACALACRVQPLRLELIDCRTHVVSEHDGNGGRSLKCCHSGCRSFSRLLQRRSKFRVCGIALLLEAKPLARMNIEIHKRQENWLVHVALVPPPFLPLDPQSVVYG